MNPPMKNMHDILTSFDSLQHTFSLCVDDHATKFCTKTSRYLQFQLCVSIDSSCLISSQLFCKLKFFATDFAEFQIDQQDYFTMFSFCH